MSVEVICVDRSSELSHGIRRYSKFQRCLGVFVTIKDRKIFAAAYGVFMLALGVALTVGYLAIHATTSSTVHTETPIPTIVCSVMVIISGILFTSLVIRKPRFMVIIMVFLCTISGIISAIGTVLYGTTIAKRLAALSDCLYTSVQRSCTCITESKTSRVWYTFENTESCGQITTHLREVVYGMCGVYAVIFVASFGAAVYGILLLHKIEIRKIKSEARQLEITTEPLKDKPYFQENLPNFIPEVTGKSVAPWQQDAATQTGDRSNGDELNCRHQCRHVVEVTVPDTNNDYVVNITKSRDPPPPYCETAYT